MRWSSPCAACDHLGVERVGDTVIARTDLGHDERVVIAGHLDTVPVKANLPSRVDRAAGRVYGRGTCDMKGGVAVMLQRGGGSWPNRCATSPGSSTTTRRSRPPPTGSAGWRVSAPTCSPDHSPC